MRGEGKGLGNIKIRSHVIFKLSRASRELVASTHTSAFYQPQVNATISVLGERTQAQKTSI